MLPAEGRKHFFKKVSKGSKREVLRACGADEEERVACAIRKLKVVVHAVVPPVVLLEAKMHQARARVRFFMGIWRGKESKQADKAAIRVNKAR